MKQDTQTNQTNQMKPKQTHKKFKQNPLEKPTAFVDLDLVEREI